MLLYISGPIKNNPGHAIQFKDASLHLKRSGYGTLDPHDIQGCLDFSCYSNDLRPKSGDGTHTWECYLKYDLIEMLKCDGIAMLPAWYKSKGALLEMTTALAVGIPVMDVRDWIANALINS